MVGLLRVIDIIKRRLMKDKEKQIFTVKVTYKADITVVVEANSADDALRIATQKAEGR